MPFDYGVKSFNNRQGTVVPLSGDYAAFYESPRVVGPTPTGIASTDTAAVYQALNDTPKGGRLWFPSSNTFFAIDPSLHQLAVTDHITIEGDSIGATSEGASVGGDPSQPISPYLVGTVFQIVTAGYDALLISGSGKSVNLRNLGFIFASGLAPTGHGVNATTTATYNGYPDLGVLNASWEDVFVYGHDGNHYGFVRTNCLLVTSRNLRSWGGGGFLTQGNHATLNAGNQVDIAPYAAVINSGTAAGFSNVARTNGGNGGVLNLLTFVRPQVMSASAMAQRAWDDLSGTGVPSQITCVGVDFEGGAAGIRKAPTTVFTGDRYVTVTPTNEVYTDRSAGTSLALAGSNYLAPAGASTLSTYAFNNGEMRMTPVWVPREVTATSLGIEVTAAGSTGAVLHFGIYSSDPVTGAPTTLLYDAGTAAATAVGIAQVTGLSVDLPAGLYWLAAVPQGAPTTLPSVPYVQVGNSPVAFSSFPTGTSNAVMQTWIQTGVTGALPATPAWSGPVSTTPPYTILGYSA